MRRTYGSPNHDHEAYVLFSVFTSMQPAVHVGYYLICYLSDCVVDDIAVLDVSLHASSTYNHDNTINRWANTGLSLKVNSLGKFATSGQNEGADWSQEIQSITQEQAFPSTQHQLC